MINLSVRFFGKFDVEAVDDVNLKMHEGELLGLVGESGSGKTMLALAVAGLNPRGQTEVTGEIRYGGVDLLKLSGKELRQIQGKDISMIFQEPMTSLNPLMKIGLQIEEPLKLHTNLSKNDRKTLALEAIEQVELPNPEKTYEKFPHQLSGGQRQRAMIAAAIITKPQLLIADEPTTALDTVVQGQIIELLKKINESAKVGILFISHDLSVVRKLCTRVAVMHNGKIVEDASTEDIFKNPQNDYTVSLINAIPGRSKRRRVI